jgi:CDP-glycerol glycerophosphotransferase (TagB/SpsB family)
VPKTKNQILLGARDGKFADNTKYFFLFLMKKETSLDFFWITKDKKLYVEFLDKGFPVLYMYSIKGFLAILKSNFILVNQLVNDASFFLMLPGKFKILNLWHGTPFKRVTIFDMKHQSFLEHTIKKFIKKIYNQKFYCVVSTCEIGGERLKDAFKIKQFPILGYPRNDVLFNQSLSFERYDLKFNLKIYSKVYLYCPTLRDAKSKKPFSNDFLSELNTYLAKNNMLFLIKWHTYEKNSYDLKNFTNILDVTNIVKDLQELLPSIDILITDYSSVSYDFALLDKPIIYYSYDLDDYVKLSRNLYANYYEEFPGPFAKNESELFNNIISITDFNNFDKEYQMSYKKFKRKFNVFVDEKSCERVYDYIINNL